MAKEAAKEEQRLVAEYDKRVAKAQSQGAQTQSGNRAPSSTGTGSSQQSKSPDQSNPGQPTCSRSGPPRSVSPSPPPASPSFSPPSQHPSGPLRLAQGPSRSSSSVIGREANSPTAILRRWLLLMAVIAGVVFAVLYATNSGPFAAPEGKGPVAVAVSPPTKEVSQKSSRVVPTSMATGMEVANKIPQSA